MNSQEAKKEIEALRMLFRGDRYFDDPRGRLTHLNILITKGLQDNRREVRLHIYRELTGLNLVTSKQLTLHVVNVLIKYFEDEWTEGLTEDGLRLLSFLKESAIKKYGPAPIRKQKQKTPKSSMENGITETEKVEESNFEGSIIEEYELAPW